MADYAEFLKAKRGRLAKQNLKTKRLVFIHRPIWLHDRATTDTLCPCCGHRFAHRIKELPHLDVIIDRVTGRRRVRHLVEDKEEFDRLAKLAHRVDMPIRCHAGQLALILDDVHRKIGAFGGNRGGKSEAEKHWFVDRILLRGGKGHTFWWVSLTRKKALEIGLRKLIKGTLESPPAFPSELVSTFPKSVQDDKPLTLFDGTEIYFHHASSVDGDNLKGSDPYDVVLDEGAIVEHEANWRMLLMRLTDHDGQLFTATTPKLGHWLQKELKDCGSTYEEIEAGAETDTAYAQLSQRSNPWLPPDAVEKNIKALGNDDLKVRAEIDGEWVAIGRQLWRHYKATEHLREGPWRDVEGWGLVNVTPIAMRRFFRGTSANLKTVAGQDFNVDPCHLEVVQVGCPKGADQSDPANWILFFLDEVVKQGTVFEFADFLALKAGAYRGLPDSYFAALPIACDATGAQQNPHRVHGVGRSSTLAHTMRSKGFDCRPCHTTDKGLPANPRILDRVSLIHKLMSDRVEFNGQSWPRLVVHGTRCPELILSIETQLADEKGLPIKRSATRSDRISGAIDAAAYIAWACFGVLEFAPPPPRFISGFAASSN